MNEAPRAAAVRHDPVAAVLGRPARRLLLAAHIALAGVWIGALAATLLLVGGAQAMPDWRAGFDRAVLLMHEQLMVNASYGFVVTGLLFSLFAGWGVFRLWWVSLKWVSLAALGLALPLWVAPHVGAMTALSDALSGAVADVPAYAAHRSAVLLGTVLQLLVLLALVVLSAFKPWGARRAHRPWPRGVSLALAAVLVVALVGNLWLQNVHLQGLRDLPVAAVDVGALRDGSYEGAEEQDGFVFRVRVTVADGRIARVDVLDNRESRYAELATLATGRLVGRTRNDIDATSGATTTSRALLRAVSAALQSAPRRGGAP